MTINCFYGFISLVWFCSIIAYIINEIKSRKKRKNTESFVFEIPKTSRRKYINFSVQETSPLGECFGCYFYGVIHFKACGASLIKEIFPCTPTERSDGRDVIWIKRTIEVNNSE